MEVGKKYVVEIEEIYVAVTPDATPQRLYRIRGFNSLVFDDAELKKLTPIEDYKLQLISEVLNGISNHKD